MRQLGFLIGRFQAPVHSGHRHLIREASKRVSRLIVFVGSANVCRSIKNPFTFIERKTELLNFFKHENITNTLIIPLNDYAYSDAQWLSDITSIISRYSEEKPVLFGFNKPGNDYLQWFPKADYENISSNIAISGQQVRQHLFETNSPIVDPDVHADYQYFKNESVLFSNYPYPDTLKFQCADSLVECNGYILLIKRKKAPGKNTWALPGGFVNKNETFAQASIRELLEETCIKVPEKVLKGSVVSFQLFDSPNRGNGIPRITVAYHYKIKPNPDEKLPKIRPADDALSTEWIPIHSALNEYRLFDDHRDIISTLLNVNPIPAHINSSITNPSEILSN